MKKILLLLIVATLSINTLAQTSTIYVIFTQAPTGPGIRHLIDNQTNLTMFRYTTHDYMVAQAGFHFSFFFAIRKTEPDDPIITKPLSFLNTVTYIDWDIVGPTLQTFQQVRAKVDQIRSYSKIYFIDKSEIVNGNMKMVPVKVPISY